MGHILIPTDWTPGDNTCTVRWEVPDSPQWLAVIKGQLTDLTKPGTWDEYSGDVDQAIETVDEMLSTLFNPGCG